MLGARSLWLDLRIDHQRQKKPFGPCGGHRSSSRAETEQWLTGRCAGVSPLTQKLTVYDQQGSILTPDGSRAFFHDYLHPRACRSDWSRRSLERQGRDRVRIGRSGRQETATAELSLGYRLIVALRQSGQQPEKISRLGDFTH